MNTALYCSITFYHCACTLAANLLTVFLANNTLTYLKLGFLFCQNTRRSGRYAPILLAPAEGWGYVVHAVEPCTTLGIG